MASGWYSNGGLDLEILFPSLVSNTCYIICFYKFLLGMGKHRVQVVLLCMPSSVQLVNIVIPYSG